VHFLADSFDVIVVGAGPGGSTAACYLSRAGKKVLLLEKAKFPRDKTCGDALSGKSMHVVRELGLVKEIEKLPHAKTTGVTFSSPSGACVSVPFAKTDESREGGQGYCMRRIYTDKMFFEAAKKEKNVKIMEEFIVGEVIFKEGKAVGVKGMDLNDGRKEKEFYAKAVVGADGVNSTVARSVLGERAALDEKHSCDAVRGYYKGIKGLGGDIEIHFFESCLPGYFWIFPLESGYANVGLGLVSYDLKKKMKTERKNLVTMLHDAIENEPLIKERFADAKLEGKITGWRLPFGSYRRQLSGEGWALVGDAASLVDPFSGEGVGNATIAGKIAAKIISGAIDAGDISASRLGEYDKEIWAELGPELQTSYRMQQVGRVKFVLNRFVEKAQKNEEFRSLLAASLANEDAKKNFANPLFYLKVLLF